MHNNNNISITSFLAL